MDDNTYKLTFKAWEQLGYPDIDNYVIDQAEDGLILAGYEDYMGPGGTPGGDGIPDFLQSIAGGGDIILKPSQDVALG